MELQAAERQNREATAGHNFRHFEPDSILQSFWLDGTVVARHLATDSTDDPGKG
jgi:hypothetical protein